MLIDNVTGLTTPALYYRERANFTEPVEPRGGALNRLTPNSVP